MADGGSKKAGEFNQKVSDPSKQTHWHEMRNGQKTFGNSQDNYHIDKTVRTTSAGNANSVPAATPGAPVPASLAGQMASYLESYLDHDHEYDDEYATVCNCNCDCNCNCGRGRI